MNPRDNVIAHIFADYTAWCKSHGIHPDPWEDFFNTLKDYDDWLLNTIRDRYNGTERLRYEDVMNRMKKDSDAWNRIFAALDPSETPFTRLPEPIQPNDEQRAVAEVIRMLGGKS